MLPVAKRLHAPARARCGSPQARVGPGRRRARLPEETQRRAPSRPLLTKTQSLTAVSRVRPIADPLDTDPLDTAPLGTERATSRCLLLAGAGWCRVIEWRCHSRLGRSWSRSTLRARSRGMTAVRILTIRLSNASRAATTSGVNAIEHLKYQPRASRAEPAPYS